MGWFRNFGIGFPVHGCAKKSDFRGLALASPRILATMLSPVEPGPEPESESESESKGVKRVRSASPDADESEHKMIEPGAFEVTFETTTPLRVLVDVVSHILKRVEYKVQKTDAFEGISIESIDPKRVCLIVAQLSCKVLKATGDPRFCVDTKVFNHCLKSIPQHYSVDIHSSPNDCDIVMNAYESLTKSYTTRCKIPTLVNDGDESSQLQDLDYDFTIEMDLATLRTIVRQGIQLQQMGDNAQDLTFRVQEPKGTHAHRHIILTIVSQGTAEQRHRFHSVTDTKDGASCVIRTDNAESADIPDEENLKLVYEESFSATYLSEFLKSMERHMHDHHAPQRRQTPHPQLLARCRQLLHLPRPRPQKQVKRGNARARDCKDSSNDYSS